MTLPDPTYCVNGVVNVKVGPLVGAIAYGLETLNLCQKVEKKSCYNARGTPGTILTLEKKSLFRRQRKTT